MSVKQDIAAMAAGLTPPKIVEGLDKHIVGQDAAKRVVAIALRNRIRRQKLSEELREEVIPKNIIMIGPTGVGKTEVARRLARLANAPFLKVEATKFTEVGYVGRDVESMVRDLVETGIKMVREQEMEAHREVVEQGVRDRLIKLLQRKADTAGDEPVARRIIAGYGDASAAEVEEVARDLAHMKKEEVPGAFDRGDLDLAEVEIELLEKPGMGGMVGGMGMDEVMMGKLNDMMSRMAPQHKRKVAMSVAQARKVLMDEELEKLVDPDKINREGLELAEQSGIIFIDEIDKVATKGGQGGPDVSRQGVQRDILPIVEGCTVNTKYGMLRTNHILFIAAGAFHQTKPSDLMPELQGRFPLRVELESLTAKDFERILTEPQSSLIDQYVALLATDNVSLNFTEDAVRTLAQSAAKINDQTENIGARRLHTILERVLQDVSFDAPEKINGVVTIDTAYVEERLGELLKDRDLSRFIL